MAKAKNFVMSIDLHSDKTIDTSVALLAVQTALIQSNFRSKLDNEVASFEMRTLSVRKKRKKTVSE